MADISTLLHAAAVSGDLNNVDMQRLVSDWAIRCGNNDILCAMLARTDVELDDEIDARIGSVNAPEVRCAWLAKPGRSIDTICDKIAKEKRATVLATLGTIDGLDPSVYHTAINASPAVRHLVAYITAENLLDEVRIAAAAALYARAGTQLSWTDETAIVNSALENPALHRALLLTEGRDDISGRLINQLDHCELTDDEATSLAERFFFGPMKELVELSRGTEAGYTEMQKMATCSTRAATLAEVSRAVSQRHGEMLDLVDAVDLSKMDPTVRRRPVEALNRSASFMGRLISEVVADLADPNVDHSQIIDAVFSEVNRQDTLRVTPTLLRAVVATGDLTGNQLAQLCDKNPLLLRSVPEQQFRSAEVAALLYQTGAAASYLFDSDDPEAAVRAVLNSSVHHQQLRLANDIVTSYPQYIGRLPITWDGRRYHRSDDVKLAVLDHMISRIGYGVSLDLLDSFSKDFVGSVDEFCELIIATR